MPAKNYPEYPVYSPDLLTPLEFIKEENYVLARTLVEQLPLISPLIATHFEKPAPCGVRVRAGISPICPEGKRYCGIPIWKSTIDAYMFPIRAERLSRLIAGNHFLELSRLLDDENRLTAKIADPIQIDKETIEEVIMVAKRLVVAGFPDSARDILEKLQAELKKTDSPTWNDPVWTARVAAVLAYFSCPPSMPTGFGRVQLAKSHLG